MRRAPPLREASLVAVIAWRPAGVEMQALEHCIDRLNPLLAAAIVSQ